MKAVKILLKVLVCLVILLLAALLSMPLWFGPVAKTAANAIVPGVVKTDFRLGHLSLNPYTARFEMGAVNLANPQKYSVKDAVRIGEMIFDAETASLMTDVIHVEELTVRDLFVSVVSGGENGVMNFKQIQYNVAGGKEKYETAQAEKESAASQKDAAAPKQGSGEKKKSKKIVIDRLEVSGLTLQLSILPLRIPSVVLTDIGRKTGGATFEETWQQILDGIMKAAGVTSDQLKAFGVLSGDAVKKTNEAVVETAKKATAVVDVAAKQISAGTEKTTAVVDGTAKNLTATAEKATKAVSSTLGAAKGIAGDSVGSAAGAAKNAAAGTVEGGVKAVDDGVKAVGEGAKKTMDALKKLW